MPVSDLKFQSGLTEKLLPFITAILTFMSVLMLMFSMHFRDWLNDWDQNAQTQLSIQVMLDKTEKLSLEEKADQIIQTLSKFEIVKMAREIDPQQVEDMLSPWLKSGFTDLKLDMPTIISVELKENDKEKINIISKELGTQYKKISVEHHQDWLETLNSFTTIARKISLSFSSLMLAVIILLIMQVTLLTLNVQKSTIDLLSILGANDKYIATRFQNHVLKFSAIGCGIGFLIALIIIYAIAFHFKSLNLGLFQNFLPKDGQFIILFLAPLLLISAIGLTARLTASYHLKRE